MTRRRAPRPISSVLPTVLERTAPKTPLAAVQMAWSRSAGDAIRREAEPVAERDGVVTIACSSAAWAEQLDLLQVELLKRLEAELEPDLRPRVLRFQVGSPGR